MPKEIFIIDSHASLYRNYFAFKLTTSKGEAVGALYGFLRLVLKIIKSKNADYIVACYDSPAKTKREEKYSLYKANRPAAEESLIEQINISKKILEALGVKTMSLDGYEADDLIAFIARNSIREGFTPVIISSDKDIFSLVGEGAVVWDGNSSSYQGEEFVKNKFSVESCKMRDYLSLIGDHSDNIPGVAGIGPKKAVALINKYGGFEEILKNAQKDDADKDPDLKKVRADIDNFKMSYELIGLDFSLPIKFSLDDFKLKPSKAEEIASYAERFEFKDLYDLSSSQEDLFSSKNYSQEDMLSLDELIKNDFDEMAVAEEMLAYGEKCAFLKDKIPQKLLDKKIKKYFYDAKEAMRVYSLKSLSNFEDIRLAYYIAFGAGRSPQIERIAREFLGAQSLPLCRLMKQVFLEIEKKLKETKTYEVYSDIEKPLVEVLFEMEKNGLKIDLTKLTAVSAFFENEIQKAKNEFYDYAKEEINLNSPKQLSFFLYEKLNIPLSDKQKSMFKTKTGYSTNEEALKAIEPFNPVVSVILRHREASKLKSSFVDVLMAKVSEDFRVRTFYDQAKTSTGRLSSSNPNLQNIPVKSEYGKLIRSCFCAGEGNILLSADYSQIDLRVLAHESRDENLIRAFMEDEDVHIKTASKIFNTAKAEVDEAMRRIAKTINFGIIYGQTPSGLSRETGLSYEQAKKYIEEYFTFYKGVKKWSQETVEFAQKNGYSVNFIGRMRDMSEMRSSNRSLRQAVERMALNMPIQSGSSDIIKKAMISIYEKIREKNDIKMAAQVHDELIFEIREDKLACFSAMIKEEMENSFKLRVPLKVDLRSGFNLAELTDYEKP